MAASTRGGEVTARRALVALALTCVAPLAVADTTLAIADTTLIQSLQATPTPARLREWHDLLASEPHIAGTDGDARQIRRLEFAFKQMGLLVETHDFYALLARPISARVEIVEEVNSNHPTEPAQSPRRGILPIIEKNLAEDPASAHPDLTWGWNAYSGSGDLTAEVVYANYATREDFARLKELNVDVTGKIVIARYGGNFRGYKAKFAQEAGAIGLLMYIDPADSGFTKGDVYPSGTWANDTCIQRGSVLALGYPGDPLTPGIEATKDAVRLEESAVALPKIVVQPIGYGAAGKILSLMTGTEVPDVAWRGGLALPYRLEGGAALKVRLTVEQKREIRRSANVIARLKGSANDGSLVIVGCHHDAWGFGAADPLAGTIVLMETARAFAESAAKGILPKCDVLFCAWGAEEFGIIGSTEWVEGHEDELKGATAYVNLDMASMGPNLGIGASPSLQGMVAAACAIDASKIGSIGGGSDHVGFLFHCGVPSVTIAAGGAPGTSYHSNYDTTAWYRKTVGEDYASAMLVTRATLAVLARCCESDDSPISAAATVAAVRKECASLQAASAKHPSPLNDARALAAGQVEGCFAALERAAAEFDAKAGTAQGRAIDRALLDPAGIGGRPWFRSLALASDRDSGYRATALPGLTDATDAAAIEQGQQALCASADRLALILKQ